MSSPITLNRLPPTIPEERGRNAAWLTSSEAAKLPLFIGNRLKT
jgi:hypothetical protein